MSDVPWEPGGAISRRDTAAGKVSPPAAGVPPAVQLWDRVLAQSDEELATLGLDDELLGQLIAT